MNQTKDFAYIKGIIRRRRFLFFAVFIPAFIIGGTIAFLLPSIYLSQSTILIENQLIPSECVQSTMTGFEDERLQVLTQRIMSRTRLVEIIERFNLYPEMKETYTLEEIVQQMKDDIKFKTISAEVRNSRSGKASSATIAFNVSFEGKHPSTVQKVANLLASLYLEENLKSREQRASITTDFLQQELDGLMKEMDKLRSRISTFKEAHMEELPEYNKINLHAIQRLEAELGRSSSRIQNLEERKILLNSQLALIDPLQPALDKDGKPIMSPAKRLQALRLELIQLKAQLQDNHPDIRTLKNIIEKLEGSVDPAGGSNEKMRQLNDVEAKLAEAEARYGPNHPDVVSLSRQVETLSIEVKAAEKATDPVPPTDLLLSSLLLRGITCRGPTSCNGFCS